MKQRAWIAFILILILLSALAAPVSASGSISSNEAFLDACSVFRAGRTEKFEISLSKAFWESLSGNDFKELSILVLEAGIADYKMQYTASGDLFLESVVWTEPHVSECATEQEFRKSIQNDIAEGLPSFQFVIRDSNLYDRLIQQGGLYAYAALCGIENLQVRSTAEAPYIIWVDELQPFRIPWYTVSSQEEWTLGIETMASQNADHFYLIMEPEIALTLQNDETLLKRLEACSPMVSWKSSVTGDYTRHEFTDVVYTTEPRIYCETEDRIVEAIRQMGASGISAFRLVLPPDLYVSASENDFAKIQELEADAGMSSCNLSYDPNLCMFNYADALIHTDAHKLSTAEEVFSVLNASVDDGSQDIFLFCTPELYSFLIGSMTADSGSSEKLIPLGDAIVHAGISNYKYTCSQASHLITVKVESLFPGTKILKAAASGQTSSLTARETETMAAARRIADQCGSADALTTARRIHDALCRLIVYTDDESTDEDDNAIGALLNGQANCDGYADAFFLTGSLAGLEIRYQHGDSYQKDPDEHYKDVTHLWNLIRINGTWRLVDVTWDDQERGPAYTWFNLGEDRAHLMHLWNKAMSVPLLEETVLSERPENEYLIPDSASEAPAVRDAQAKKYPSFSLVFPGGNPSGKEEILETLKLSLAGSFSYDWNEYMRTMTVWPESH